MTDSARYDRTIGDYLGIARRRRWILVVPAAVIFSLALAAALLLPAVYQSRATILVEEQEVSQDFVRSLNNNFAAQQIQVISQRVLTLDTITDIVNRHGLYQEEGGSPRKPTLELARTFRRNMELELVSADIIDPRSRRPSEATIAFTLTFLGPTPETTQNVTNDLVTLFLDENKRNRTDQANSTSEFLANEANRVKEELDSLQNQLAAFKEQHDGMLPEQYKFNLNALERAERELSDVTLRIQKLRENRVELDAEISQTSPNAPMMLPSGDVVMTDQDRMKALQAEYRRATAIYRDNHPDVIRLKREIETLEAEMGEGVDVADLQRQLYEQRSRLEDLRARYNDNYHEVQSVQRIVDQLQASIAAAGQPGTTERAVAKADNPAYVLLRTKINDIDSELRTLAGKRTELEQRMSNYESLISRAPEVEREYTALEREYATVEEKYSALRSQQREATAASNLEQEQKGQRFLLIEPPVLPTEPVSPNRSAIVFLGAVLGLGAGVALVLLRETLDGAIHGVNALTAAMGTAPLVAVPYLEVREEGSTLLRVAWTAVLLLFLFALLSLWYVHSYYMPLGQIMNSLM